MMYGYVYETTCLVNGKKYIGQHKSECFDEKYLGSGKTFVKALNKYGKENFKCKILKECYSREELNASEKYFIKLNEATNSSAYYNISEGGEGHCCEPWNKGKQGVQERTAEMENALEKGRHLPPSDKLKQKLSEYRKNVIVSDDTKEKLRHLQLGKICVNNGLTNKYIRQDELETYLNNGFVKGKLFKNLDERTAKFKQTHYSKDNSEWKNKISNSIKGRIWVNNNIDQHQIKKEELDTYINNGYSLGRIKAKRFND